MGPRTALSIDNEFDPAKDLNVLCLTPLVQCRIVSQQYGGVWPDASDQ